MAENAQRPTDSERSVRKELAQMGRVTGFLRLMLRSELDGVRMAADLGDGVGGYTPNGPLLLISHDRKAPKIGRPLTRTG